MINVSEVVVCSPGDGVDLGMEREEGVPDDKET